MKKNSALVFGITSNLTFALANVLLGLKKHSPAFTDDIFIYYDSISEKEKKLINSIIPCNFIKYKFPIKDTSRFNQDFFKQFSSLAYSRYECFNLLNQYKNVLWFDVDILIQKNISMLLEGQTTGIKMWTIDEKNADVGFNFLTPLDNYDMTLPTYNSGIIVFSDNLPKYGKMTDWCYEKTKEWADKLYLPDQAVLSILLQEFNIQVTPLSEKFNCHPTCNDVRNAYIVHTYCPEKFWNFWNFKEWHMQHKKWLEMGGGSPKIKRGNFVSRFSKKHWGSAPDPVRKPRQFLIYFLKKLIFKFCQ